MKKVCAYCFQTNKLTKEHVIPDWYIRLNRSEDDVCFSERAPKKFVPEMVVRDVCESCNNLHLSRLDAYGKELYEKHFKSYVFKDQSVQFTYDYQRLLKWLIKCSYNSARANNADLEVLKDYARYLISDDLLPNDIIIFCATIAPSDTTAFDAPVLAKETVDELYGPNWFRLGVFRVKDFDSIDYSFRSVSINSYSFSLVLPKLKSDCNQQKRILLSKMNNSEVFGVRLTESGSVMLGPPVMDAIRSFQHQIMSNPLAYGIEKNTLSDYMREEGPSRLVYLIPREDIEGGVTNDLENFFLYLTSSREIALMYMQKVEFVIHGYDDDPRELYDIQDVIEYLGRLNKIFPYWLFYQFPEGKWLDILLVCLSKGTIKWSTPIIESMV